MRREKKGPEVRKLTGPKRMAWAKRLLESKKRELESQEARAFLEFMRDYPFADEISLSCAELLWAFLVWLRSKKIHLVDEHEVFCFPFSKLVAKKDLK